MRRRFGVWIGLAGVANDENARARRAGQVFEWILVPLALWLPIQWSLEASGDVSTTVSSLFDWGTWLLFVLEALVLARLTDRPLRYFRGNWLNLLIIVAGLPVLWSHGPWATTARALRLLLMLSLLSHVARTVRAMLAQNRLGPILVSIVIVTTLGGAIIGYFDPGFSRPLDGIWWAWVTVTTVGYGDMVPQTPAARVFAVILMLLGVSMIALLSASLVTFFQEDEEREAMHIRRMMWIKLQHMEADAEARAHHNEELLTRLAAIEMALLRSIEERTALERKIETLLTRPSTDSDAVAERPKGNSPHGGPDG